MKKGKLKLVIKTADVFCSDSVAGKIIQRQHLRRGNSCSVNKQLLDLSSEIWK